MPWLQYIFLALIGFGSCGQLTADTTKDMIGWIEPVRLESYGIEVIAKIDTGADHSSLSALGLQTFEKSGTTWVSFEITDINGRVQQISQPVNRYAKVKQQTTTSQKRPVIKLSLCIGDHARTVDVNLTDRTSYKYKMIIGRSFLKGLYLVDVDDTHLSRPQCQN